MTGFQRRTQTVTFVLFLGLLLLAAYPYQDGLMADLFLRMDPLAVVGTILAAREFAVALVPGLFVLAVALVAGRLFCGHICPMGTTIDLGERVVTPKKKPASRDNSYEATTRYRNWKYIALAVILSAGVGGVSLVHLGSPLSLVTRFYGLVAWPLTLRVGELGLQGLAPVLDRFPMLASAQIAQRVSATNLFVAGLFVGIVLLASVQPRFWCRNLCPAGGLMGLFSRKPLMRRQVSDSCNGCGRCVRECPTSAILEEPAGTVHSECIVCLHCVEICPQSAVSFTWGAAPAQVSAPPSPDLTRRALVLSLGSGIVTAGLLRTGIQQPRALGRDKPLVDEDLIRPPGAVPELEFLTRCIRCGECMKACATNTLQPVWLMAGLEGIFTPAMAPRLAACAINCTVCGRVCPTGAIRDLPLIEKQHVKVGTAWIERRNCLVWEQDKKCLVCDECCPYNAVSFRSVPERKNAVPFVVGNRCTGCGWCENKCPVEGKSAIRVNIIGEVRLASGSYVEKAAEYGLVFKASDNKADRLAPDTFIQRDPHQGPALLPDSPAPPADELPPGFITK